MLVCRDGYVLCIKSLRWCILARGVRLHVACVAPRAPPRASAAIASERAASRAIRIARRICCCCSTLQWLTKTSSGGN